MYARALKEKLPLNVQPSIVRDRGVVESVLSSRWEVIAYPISGNLRDRATQSPTRKPCDISSHLQASVRLVFSAQILVAKR